MYEQAGERQWHKADGGAKRAAKKPQDANDFSSIFRPGRFQPGTSAGRQLMGHELAHVVQGRQARQAGLQTELDPNYDYFNLNGEKFPEGESKNAKVLVLTKRGSIKKIEEAIQAGHTMPMISPEEISVWEQQYEQSQKTGNETLTATGQNGMISRIVEGDKNSVDPTPAYRDLLDKGDVGIRDAHTHPLNKTEEIDSRSTTYQFGRDIPSPGDLDDQSLKESNRVSVVLGFREFKPPPDPNVIGGKPKVEIIRSVGFYNKNGRIEVIDFERLKSVIMRIHS